MPLIDFTIPDPPPDDPWHPLPEAVETIRSTVLAHQLVEMVERGDVSVEACRCGANIDPDKVPDDQWDDPAQRSAFRRDALRRHWEWRWEDHFREVWNEMIGRVA
jgi:hypothetical protein